MQNKGFVTIFAVALVLVCCFYLSFSFVTRQYNNKAVEYANGDEALKAAYLDSMATEKVWLGYTLKECREKEIGLGLDLKGGMSVTVEVDAAAVLRSLGDVDNLAFITALNEASEENRKGSNRDYISIFVDKFIAKNGANKLAPIFANKLRDAQITPTDADAKVIVELRKQLQSAADNSFNVLRTRIDRFGVVSPNIQKLDRAERILIELPGIQEPDRVRKLMQGNANLEFWKTYAPQEVQQSLMALNVRSQDALAMQKDSTISADSAKAAVATLGFSKAFNAYLQAPPQAEKPEDQIYLSQASIGLVNKNDTAAVNTIINKYRNELPSDLQFAWGFKAEDRKETLFALYLLRGDGIKKGPALDGDVIADAKADQRPNTVQWEVSMRMNSQGAQRWATITGAEVNKAIAIVLDGYVYSAPNVQNKIEGGSSSITGRFTYDDAKDLENVLKSGRMKAGVRIVQEDVVGPSLGEEAIQAGIISFVLALLIILVYMCLAYGLIPGLIADAALLVNLFFTMGILASFGAVMTLPGITGLILTLAMAIDANVLIYERIKEELRAGKNMKTALVDGYKHAFSAIFDSNLTHIISGVILFYFGTGAIQGFATTLIIGILISFFTAVYLTRLFYSIMLDKGHFKNLTFTTSITKNLFVHTTYNFLSKTKIAFAISGIVILAGIVSLFVNHLNTGIDFTGGRNYTVRFDKEVHAGELEKALIPEFEGSNVRVITSGAGSQSTIGSQVRITTNYKIEDQSATNNTPVASQAQEIVAATDTTAVSDSILATTDSISAATTDVASTNNAEIAGDAVDREIRDKITHALQASGALAAGESIDQHIISSQKVGPSVADDLKKSASIAVVIAIFCMAIYILIRFRDVAFSVGTFVAVAHDAAIVIFLYSLLYKIAPFSMEIDQAFIAAILTVVGYTINDKVVIFDRIRELRRTYPKRNLTHVINESLNSTLGRTINTSLSSLLVVFCIFILGGDSIRSFTFAIFIGIFVGTYSSVFIATPIAWMMLKKKQNPNEVED